jgi:hypothetical protein
MLLAVGMALVMSASASAVVAFNVEKSVVGAYFTPGDTITYEYRVTSNEPFVGVTVTDNLCGLATYVSGDSNNNGVLNGGAGEIWLYQCQMPAPAVNPSNDLANTGTAQAKLGNEAGPTYTDTDTYTLEAAVLRKQVALYWEYSHVINASGTGDVQFGVDVFQNGVDIGSEFVSANTPLSLWLTPGTWLLQEQTPPTGYVGVPGRTSWNIGVIPREPNPRLDNTIFNIAPFDLAIEKTGPVFAYVGDQVTYTYTVTNTGTGVVTPQVSDDKCGPATYVSGDTNNNGKIEASETWTFTCTYTPGWVFPGPLTNTATVSDVEYPETWTPLYGGDTNASNNTDTYSLYPFVLRKEVGLYNDGQYPDFSAFADNTVFNVKAFLGGVQKGAFTISENSPKQLWLGAGTWTFQEYNLPAGHFAVYPNATITFVTGTYPDWTHLNVTWSGCSHGYWKNHTDDWNAPYTPASSLIGVFGPNALSGDFDDALAFPGGPGVEGAKRILLRQAVAALLNEAEYGAAFGPYSSTGALISAVSTALGTGNRGTMLSLAGTLDYWNNGVCRN